MADFELVIRGGTVVTASDTVRADIGIRGGRIAAAADSLPDGARIVDGSGLPCRAGFHPTPFRLP